MRTFVKRVWPKNQSERVSYYLLACMAGLIALGVLTG